MQVLVQQLTARKSELDTLSDIWGQMVERCKSEMDGGHIDRDTEQHYKTILSDIQVRSVTI